MYAGGGKIVSQFLAQKLKFFRDIFFGDSKECGEMVVELHEVSAPAPA